MSTISNRLRRCLAASVLLAAGCGSTGALDVSGMSFSPAPLVGKFVWHDLVTDDPDSARRFYAELFGWTFDETTGPAGPYYVARVDGVYVAGLVSVAAAADGAVVSRWLPYLSVADVDDAIVRGTERGARVVVGARNVPLGRVAALVDPEGAVLGIARSRLGDPDDATTRAGPGRVVWNELLSDHPEQAARFYGDAVGYTLQSVDRRGGEYRFLETNGIRRAGIQPMPAAGWDPLWLTYFGVDDVRAAAARVESLGGRLLLAPDDSVREGSMAVIADPSGAILVLQNLTGPVSG